MSDAIIIAIVGGVFGVINTGGIIAVAVINSKGNKKIATNVEVYHKEINGKMETLLKNKDELSKTKEELAGVKGQVIGAGLANQAATDSKNEKSNDKK